MESLWHHILNRVDGLCNLKLFNTIDCSLGKCHMLLANPQYLSCNAYQLPSVSLEFLMSIFMSMINKLTTKIDFIIRDQYAFHLYRLSCKRQTWHTYLPGLNIFYQIHLLLCTSLMTHLHSWETQLMKSIVIKKVSETFYVTHFLSFVTK